MTNEEEETARELIQGAFTEQMNGAPTVNDGRQLLEMVAGSLRDEPDFVAELRAGKSALVEIQLHELGKHSEEKSAGLVRVSILSLSTDQAQTDLIARLTNDKATGLALVNYAKTSDGEALMFLIASPNGELAGAMAELTGNKETAAFFLDDETIAEKQESTPSMIRALFALRDATQRKTATL